MKKIALIILVSAECIANLIAIEQPIVKETTNERPNNITTQPVLQEERLEKVSEYLQNDLEIIDPERINIDNMILESIIAPYVVN